MIHKLQSNPVKRGFISAAGLAELEGKLEREGLRTKIFNPNMITMSNEEIVKSGIHAAIKATGDPLIPINLLREITNEKGNHIRHRRHSGSGYHHRVGGNVSPQYDCAIGH